MTGLGHPDCMPLLAFDGPIDGQLLFGTPRISTDVERLIKTSANGWAPRGWDATGKSIVAFGIASGLGFGRTIRPEQEGELRQQMGTVLVRDAFVWVLTDSLSPCKNLMTDVTSRTWLQENGR
jgi:hypothetical protein